MKTLLKTRQNKFLIFSLLCASLFTACEKEKSVNDILTPQVSDYVPLEYEKDMNEVVSAINFGLINAPLKEVEGDVNSKLRSVDFEIDYGIAEQLAYEKLGILYPELKSTSVDSNTLSEEELQQTIELMS